MLARKRLLILSFFMPILCSIWTYVPLFFGSDSYVHFNKVIFNEKSNSLYVNTVTKLVNNFSGLSLEQYALICKICNSIILGLIGVLIMLSIYETRKLFGVKDNKRTPILYILMTLLFSVSPVIIQRFNFNFFDTDPIIALCYTFFIYSVLRNKFWTSLLNFANIIIFINVWGNAIEIIVLMMVFSLGQIMFMIYNNYKNKIDIKDLKNIREWSMILKIMVFLFIVIGLFLILLFILLLDSFIGIMSSNGINMTSELQPNIFYIFAYLPIIIFIILRVIRSITYKKYIRSITYKKYRHVKEYYLSYLILVFYFGSILFSRLNYFMVIPLIIYIASIKGMSRKYRTIFRVSVIFIWIISYIFLKLVMSNEAYYIPHHVNETTLLNLSVDYLVVPYQYNNYVRLINPNLNTSIWEMNNTIKSCNYYNIMCKLDEDKIIYHYNKAYYYYSINNTEDNLNLYLCKYCESKIHDIR